MREPFNLDDIPKGQWVEVTGEQVADILQAVAAKELEDLYGVLGESPEAWKGAAILASGLYDHLTGTNPDSNSRMTVMHMAATLYTLLRHPLADKAINDYLAEHPERGHPEDAP